MTNPWCYTGQGLELQARAWIKWGIIKVHHDYTLGEVLTAGEDIWLCAALQLGKCA